ncbi:UNVERIFIED_CONTAM: hypothetical protein Sindi_0945700 [Sesamum indicum]
MSTPAGHVTAGDGPTITEEDEEETDRSSGDYSGGRYGETTNFGKESERTRDHFSATNGSGTILDADARIQTEKEVNLAGETTRFEAPLDLGRWKSRIRRILGIGWPDLMEKMAVQVSPENQSWPESGHIPTMNSSPPTCADVDPVKNDVENAVDFEADVGICADVMHEVLNDVMDM